ncbi:hypothetical protein [Helicobacter sp.]|uniref:hypothetical protein n=1 Tax=Helicobacter sp. TaxID=218 RepID=UPI0019B1A20A|nr:hypothetical protein [Helicobacter sp.]MBD5165225.1 hypothetical protein [Helicobacter sp.]
MKQNVHNVSYLAVTTLNLKTIQEQSYPAVALPSGAEVLNVSVEVQEEADAGTKLKVGLASDEEFFANDLDLATKSNYTSAKTHKMQSTGTINVKASKTSEKGAIIVRAFYFLPSQIMTEF